MSEPNRTHLNDAPELRDEATAAYQLTADEPLQESPGGGGMGGLSAAQGTANAIRPQQAAPPSNPASPAVGGDAAALQAQKEAQHLSDSDERKPLPGGA